MKHPALLAAASVAFAFSFPALAADDHAGHHHAMTMATEQADTALTDGTVKKVDKAAGKLTVSHGPLPNGMPAMTMAFRVKEAGWLDQLKSGDHIRFVAEDAKGGMTIIRLEAMH